MMADGVDGGSEERETVGGPAVTRRSFAAAASVALPALMLQPQARIATRACLAPAASCNRI
jgi:hypothetical protein